MKSSIFFERFGVPTPFDPNFYFVTSPVLSPLVLGVFRLLFAVYALITTITTLAFDSLVLHDVDSYFSYFTNLSYIGLLAYFWAASAQTLAFELRRRKNYPLQKWPRLLQLLHVLLYTTVVVFPIIVTVVYWTTLASAQTFQTTYDSFDNVSHHALNTVFALFEIFLTHAGPSPWLHLPPLILLLALYLGVAYLTHATQGIYTYSFLNPDKGALLAAYLVGIPVGCCIVFGLVKGACHLRRRLSFRYGRFDDYSDKEGIDEWQNVAAPEEVSVSEL